MKKRHVIIVGGGASGLMAGIFAAREGAEVTIIEQKERLGKKILSTGNGRCNLTNEVMHVDCFRGDDVRIVSPVLKQFGYTETIAFFEELGVILKNKQGYIYPITEQASTILDALCLEIEALGVDVILEESVIGIRKTKSGFEVKTKGSSYVGDAVILATGGRAASVLGSDGSGYRLAKQFGHHLSSVVPALVQLKGKSTLFKQVAGVRTHAKVTIFVDGQEIECHTGELQLTNYGISGIPVFQISRYASKGLLEKKKVTVEVDFLPHMSDEAFLEFIKDRFHKHGEKKAKDFMVGIFHAKLIGLLLKISRISANQKANTITEEQLQLLMKVSKHFIVEIEGTNDFDQAQICAGGVRTAELNFQTMESLYQKNFYLTGELLDVDGICGGYNLQWAWATGAIAGKNAAKGT